MRRIYNRYIILSSLLFSLQGALDQTGNGRFNGYVLFENGTAVKGATLEAIGLGLKVETDSNERF